MKIDKPFVQFRFVEVISGRIHLALAMSALQDLTLCRKVVLRNRLFESVKGRHLCVVCTRKAGL